jgi:hypothetical protein
MLVSIMFQYGFDETAFWFILTILLLVFFSYFTYKIFTKKEFIDKWKRTLKITTIGSIVFALIIGLIGLIMQIHLSSYEFRNMPEGLDFSYAIGISFLSLLFAFILIIMISINFYKDFKIAKSNKV